MSPRELPPSFEAWWADKASAQAAMCRRKAAEYGADDLYEMGTDFINLMQSGPGIRPAPMTFTDTDAYLAGVFWYVLGKVKRWQSALKRRQNPSKDTLEDLVVYAMMALHEMERSERVFEDPEDLRDEYDYRQE